MLTKFAGVGLVRSESLRASSMRHAHLASSSLRNTISLLESQEPIKLDFTEMEKATARTVALEKH